MTDHDDDLMQRLAAADPVDQHRLPSANDLAPRHLMETIMGLNRSDDWPATGTEDGWIDDPGFEEAELADMHRARRPRRSRAYLAAVAAAVVLLVGSLAIFIPGSSAPALAAVHSAAQATADIDSGTITVTFTLNGTAGDEPGSLAGRLVSSYNGTDASFDLDIDDLTGALASAVPPAVEARFVDGVAYLSDGDGWYSMTTGGIVDQAIIDLIDPRSVLPTVQELTETEEVGPAEIDGVATTHYRSVVDLGDESLTRSGWLAMDFADVDAEGEVVIDLFVDASGLLRQLDVSGDVSDSSAAGHDASFTVSTSFTDFGGDIVIEAPAGAVELGPLQGLGGN
jgi:hypothetical protein